MKKLLIYSLSLLILLVGSNSLYAVENITGNNQKKDEFIEQDINKITEDVSRYFSKENFIPYIIPGTFEIKINGFITEEINKELYLFKFLNVDLYQNDQECKALVGLEIRKSDKNTTVRNLYLTNGETISPRLFFSILKSPFLMKLCPKVKVRDVNKPMNIFIDTKLPSENGYTAYKWTFFDAEQTASVKVLMKEDLMGETNFLIKKFHE